MNVLIKKLEDNGLIQKIDISFDQVSGHLKRAERDVIDAKATININPELTFTCAYNAMLHAGRALIFSYGFRPIDTRQHQTVVEFCGIILGDEFSFLVKKYNQARQKRNIFIYDAPEWNISELEALNTLKTAEDLISQIRKIIKENNPQKELEF